MVSQIKNPEDLCLRLAIAESEIEVENLLRSEGLWDDLDNWVSYGDTDMNRSIVGNQQSSPVAALVEKIINSLDAVLTYRCMASGVDPKASQAPKTMQEAVEQLFRIKEGKIQNLTPGERTAFAENIKLVATGSKKNPNYIIMDKGEGQHPDDFKNTFLSLLRENKTGILFVQGKFNMGGTGILQFCGKHSFQLIVSKKHPELAKDDQKEWGFTILRRLDPDIGQGRPYSKYVYLAPGGKIPRFSTDFLPLSPGRYPQPYEANLEAGSFIKVWNLKLPGALKTNLMLDMRRALEKQLPEPALPIRLFERRNGYRAHSYETTMSGLSSIIADNPEHIEDGLDTGTPLNIPSVGQVQVRLTVVKEKHVQGRTSIYPKGGIFFIVNGQLHSVEDKNFFERRTKLDYISNSTLVSVDCTRLSERTREDLFLGSRDRMRECYERNKLYDQIASYLKDHPGLKEINARRRAEKMSQAISEEETAKLFQDLIKDDPTLAELFQIGHQIKVPKGQIPDSEEFKGNEFPTYFHIYKEPKGGLVRNCPKNRRCRIIYETDAENDYFSRSKDPGRVEVSGSPILASIHLWKGKATLTFELPEHSNPGDMLNVKVEVTDISRIEPFSSSFKIHVEEEAPLQEKGGKPRPGAFFTGLPKILEVWRDEWADWGFNERSALLIKRGGDGEQEDLDIAINMDNIFLRNEKGKRKTFDPKILNYWFKYGLCLQAMGMLYSQKKRLKEEDTDAEEDGNEHDFDTIKEVSEGLAVTIIPIIAHLSKEATLIKTGN